MEKNEKKKKKKTGHGIELYLRYDERNNKKRYKYMAGMNE